MFHQIEGLRRSCQHHVWRFEGTLDHAMKEFFGSKREDKFSSVVIFPVHRAERGDVCFVASSAEGRETRRGAVPSRASKTGWIEILGCGMVDPNVFEFVKDNGYDPKSFGIRFGMGADRIALLKYGVDDLQLFFNGDVRFLGQFRIKVARVLLDASKSRFLDYA